MTMLSGRRNLANLTAFLLWSLATSAWAKEVPFTGSIQWTFDPPTIALLDPPTFLVVGHGIGEATQLGKFSVEAPHYFNPATLSETGSYFFTAANGDVLYATFVGQGTPTGTPGGLNFIAPATILGGSGRFRGATGTFTVMATVSQITLDGSAEFSGTISIPEEERE